MAAAEQVAVDHVVVQQEGEVQQLEGRGEAQDLGLRGRRRPGRLAHRVVRGQEQARAEQLAALGVLGGELPQVRHAGSEPGHRGRALGEAAGELGAK